MNAPDFGPLFQAPPPWRDENKRLGKQTEAVFQILRGGEWFTLQRLAIAVRARGVGATEAGVSARLRQLRNEFGWVIEKRRAQSWHNGLYEYCLTGQWIEPNHIQPQQCAHCSGTGVQP